MAAKSADAGWGEGSWPVRRWLNQPAIEIAPGGRAAAKSAGADLSPAKLTGMVTIAVFAAFRFCIGHILLSDAEFKPDGVIWQLDVWCYGWQKRQDRGKNGKASGTVSTDSGTIWHVQGAVARRGCAGMRVIRLDMRLFRCLRRRMAPC